MTYLRLIDLGTHLSSRDRARRLRAQLEQELGEGGRGRCTVDLEGVVSISHSFADEFFAILVRAHGLDWFRSTIRLSHAQPAVRESILRSVDARLAPAGKASGRGLSAPPTGELAVEEI